MDNIHNKILKNKKVKKVCVINQRTLIELHNENVKLLNKNIYNNNNNNNNNHKNNNNNNIAVSVENNINDIINNNNKQSREAYEIWKEQLLQRKKAK